MKLELIGITKRFGSLVANDAISLTVEPGQIHALLGENGAGKSTLMNILYGLYTADSGDIQVDGKKLALSGPADAIAAGIGMVHQHFMLIPVLTVAENVVLGHEPTSGPGILDLDEARRRVRDISARFGFDIDPDARIEDLPVGVQQRVEIIKALAREARVLVLDEPTAVLTPQETDELMEIMRELARTGTSIVFITHKLREVKAVADIITVIRQGRVVGSAPPSASTEELATMMVGRDVTLTVQKGPSKPGPVVLEVSGISVRGVHEATAVDDVSFQVRAGEIVAFAGVQGNGQTELAETLVGLRKPHQGDIALEGESILELDVKDILARGVGYIPEDRKKDGLVGQFSVAENLMLNRLGEAPFVKGLALDLAGRFSATESAMDEFDVRASGPESLAAKLSGGNQQKIVLARELTRPLRVLIASQPTRGVDVGSVEFIHERIVAARDAGVAVVIVSTELDEVFSLADRIVVMYRGRIVGEVDPSVSRERLGQMMAGVVSV